MGAGKPLTEFQKGAIQALMALPEGERPSLRQMEAQVGCSRKAISNYLKDPVNYGKRHTKGRPKKMSARDTRRLFRVAAPGDLSAPKLVKKLELNVSKSTVSRTLASSGIFQYVKMNKAPQLTEAHKHARVAWGTKYASTSDDTWAKTIFSDEKKWNLDGPDGLKYYWHCRRNDPKAAFSRQKGGGSVMVWGAFHANGTSELVFLEGNQCADDYVQTLEDHLLPVIRHQIRRGAIFQQDNASIHTARTTKAFFKRAKIRVMDWPAKSPDLNPIENVWGYMAGIVYACGKQYDTKEELELAIQAAWSNLDPNYLRRLSQGMKKRCLDVYKANGEHIGK